MGLAFPAPPRTGRVVVDCSGVRFGYGDVAVYESLDFVLERSHKVALVGPNGAGKTTLLKLVAGALEPQGGTRTLGHNVGIGYFAQHQIEALDPDNRVLDEMTRAIPPGAELNPRALLGRFLFSGDSVDKPVRVLSGGERTRLAMAKLLASPVSVLCLDEPTNHLDIPSRDVLEDALVEYAGALVLITHDRHLIGSVANRIVEVVDGRVTAYDGDYEYYASRRDQQKEQLQQPAPSPAPRKSERRRTARGPDLNRLRAAVGRIEDELVSVHAEMARISDRLADPGTYDTGADVAALAEEYERHAKRVSELEDVWEQAAERLEEQEVAEGA